MTPARQLLRHWRSAVVVLAPALLAPLALHGQEGRCALVVVLMSVYWMTEALPLPVTSLLPVVLFPLLGVLGTDKVCAAYLQDTNMMFIGGLIVAIAVEHCNLHKRIALNVILLVGTSPMRLMMGFMLTTTVLSMWISNTATTAMMVPIVHAVLDQLNEQRKAEKGQPSSAPCVVSTPDSEQASGVFDPETRRKSVCRPDCGPQGHPDAETVCYFLGVAYASNLGGAGTLTGSATNLTFKGLWDQLYPGGEGATFATWVVFNVPLMLVNVLAAWLWLQILFMRLFRRDSTNSQTSPRRAQAIEDVIRAEVDRLGPVTFHEACTLLLFVALVLLWFFRQPEFMPGWAAAVSPVPVMDATPVMLIVILFFILPSELSFLSYFKRNERNATKPAPALLNWKLIHEKVPWGLVLLLGGGFAMAAASKESGLSELLGRKLAGLQVLPRVLILAVVCTATTFITEVSSNTAVANIVLPVLANMAVQMGTHPMYFMMPATLCCSYAFMLPVATPPNAIVLAASNMRTTDMIKAGFGMNIICLLILLVLFPTFGFYVYSLGEFPSYANVSAVANTTLEVAMLRNI
ncbi:protein I'm not dead yet [Bacillus rossius redtenbacheri]|uniref:protein I'm not dead yet n=1 Tax=Bacillus rossius redtenbacheri TaxID=93214 RepID=UPI002FDE881E